MVVEGILSFTSLFDKTIGGCCQHRTIRFCQYL
jgi:hypothetical protein